MNKTVKLKSFKRTFEFKLQNLFYKKIDLLNGLNHFLIHNNKLQI
jgi:hypothetical protein